MNRKFNFAFLLFLLFSTIRIYGQTYYLSVSQQAYTPLVNGFPLTEGVWDDPSYSVPIGFEFELFDQAVSALQSSDLLLGGALGVDFSGSTTSILQVYGPDLIDRGYQTGSSMSTIYFRTDGTAGQRIFTQEWNNVGFFNGVVENGIYKDFINFQLKIYEESGDIVFHFGPSLITNAFQNYEGASGPSVALVNELDLMGELIAEEVILLSGSPSNPTVITEFIETYLTGDIPENTVYRFSKSPSSTGDYSVILDRPFLVPNPTRGRLQINPADIENLLFPIRIYDASGRLVTTIVDAGTLDLSDFAPGLYEARFMTLDGPAGQRILLQ